MTDKEVSKVASYVSDHDVSESEDNSSTQMESVELRHNMRMPRRPIIRRLDPIMVGYIGSNILAEADRGLAEVDAATKHVSAKKMHDPCLLNMLVTIKETLTNIKVDVAVFSLSNRPIIRSVIIWID